jgi:hypothetical protein
MKSERSNFCQVYRAKGLPNHLPGECKACTSPKPEDRPSCRRFSRGPEIGQNIQKATEDMEESGEEVQRVQKSWRRSRAKTLARERSSQWDGGSCVGTSRSTPSLPGEGITLALSASEGLPVPLMLDRTRRKRRWIPGYMLPAAPLNRSGWCHNPWQRYRACFRIARRSGAPGLTVWKSSAPPSIVTVPLYPSLQIVLSRSQFFHRGVFAFPEKATCAGIIWCV